LQIVPRDASARVAEIAIKLFVAIIVDAMSAEAVAETLGQRACRQCADSRGDRRPTPPDRGSCVIARIKVARPESLRREPGMSRKDGD
jgi:hypothetical protein